MGVVLVRVTELTLVALVTAEVDGAGDVDCQGIADEETSVSDAFPCVALRFFARLATFCYSPFYFPCRSVPREFKSAEGLFPELCYTSYGKFGPKKIRPCGDTIL
jgi:hypothetical protein